MDTSCTQVRFPCDSNIRYLPLVFLIPENQIIRYPTLNTIPRCLSEIAASAQMIDLIDSDAFLKEILDAVADLVFPYFGFGGWKEHYTGYCPVWQLSYALRLWVKLVEQESGWGLQRLFSMKPGTQIGFPNEQQVQELFARVVKRGIKEQGWQPILDTVKELPCDEDFEKWDTNVRKDFLRKWYHTRSKKVQTISLEGLMESGDEDSTLFQLPDPRQNVEEYVIANDLAERFLASLSEKDRQIVQLRQEGFTYGEIAQRLGYKNHSGVIKRLEAIRKKYRQYTGK